LYTGAMAAGASAPGIGRKSPFPWRLFGAATFFFLLSGALGYYGWTLRGEHQEGQSELDRMRERAATLETTEAKVAALMTEVSECQKKGAEEVDRCKKVEASMTAMQENLSATRGEIESLRSQREETEKELGAFKELTEKFQKMIDGGKLNVEIRKGRMSVKLPAGVLFDSGSAKLSRDGELALMEVAIILRTLTERKFMVAGHTDNRPLEDSTESGYRNNWELSTARAVTVTEFLIEARMKPENLVAAGYGQYDPVGDNNSADGRQENRRIEIVLLPNLETVTPIASDPSSKAPPASAAP
jgi:chemotaxis protein MotB